MSTGNSRTTRGRRHAGSRMLAALFSLCLLASGLARAESYEVALSEADFKQLDTDEADMLAKADSRFAKQDYRAAVAEYDLFLVTYPRSFAAAYALVRKGRSQMSDNKRNEAVMTFKEVVDYFPDSVTYAAAALYYQGLCYFMNGERMNAVKVWKKMVADKEYAKHMLAAPALVSLADELVRQEKFTDAVTYYEQVAVDFRNRSAAEANRAIGQACWIHVRVMPNENKLSDFYARVRTTRSRPEEPNEDKYWEDVRALVHGHGGFPAEEQENRSAYFKYWAGVMEGKRLKDNAFRIDWAWFRLQHEGKVDNWIKRLDDQFAATYKPGQYAQIIQFLRAFGPTKEKVEEYYRKFKFEEMNNEQIVQVIMVLINPCAQPGMARSACDRIDHTKWNDRDRDKFLTVIWRLDEGLVTMVCRKMRDADFGRYRLLSYYHEMITQAGKVSATMDQVLALADEVTKAPQYTGDAFWMKAGLLCVIQKYQEAIGAYINSNKEPQSLFRIADCWVTLRKKDEAVAQLTEIENFFPNSAAEAALKIAYVLQGFGDEKGCVAAFRNVMKKYPKTGQSNTAHIELERRGKGMGGGIDAD